MKNILIETNNFVIRDLELKDLSVLAETDILSFYNNSFLDRKYYLSKMVTEQYNQPRTSFSFVVTRKDNSFIGLCRLNIVDNSTLMMPCSQGEAQFSLFVQEANIDIYGKEIIQSLLRFGFEKINLKRIFCLTDTTRRIFHKILEENGFRQEAELKEYLYYDGSWHDQFQYAVLDSDLEI